jgi:ankyrin repeat protein
MSAPKRARDEPAGAAAAGGAGGPPPPPLPPPPARHLPPAKDDDTYERRLKLTDVIGFVALNGYAREADACAGLNRETWRCIPAGLSAADADRVRRDHPLWQAIINLGHGRWNKTRLALAAQHGSLSRVRMLCDWLAQVEVVDMGDWTPLFWASVDGRIKIVRELLARGANIEAATARGETSLYVASGNGHLAVVCELLAHGTDPNTATVNGETPLIESSYYGHVEVVRALLAAGADKHRVANNGHTAASLAGTGVYAAPPPAPPSSHFCAAP